MTSQHIDRLAAKVAAAMNGGACDTHYADPHKAIWRARVIQMISSTKEDTIPRT